MPTGIQGYLGTITLNSVDISAEGRVVRLNKTRNVMTKPRFGSQWSASLGGQRIANFSAQGHVTADKIADLEAMFDAESIAFSIQIGEATEASDAGVQAGVCIVSSYTIEANADGEWDWSIDAQSDEAVTHTPAV